MHLINEHLNNKNSWLALVSISFIDTSLLTANIPQPYTLVPHIVPTVHNSHLSGIKHMARVWETGLSSLFS